MKYRVAFWLALFVVGASIYGTLCGCAWHASEHDAVRSEFRDVWEVIRNHERRIGEQEANHDAP